MTDPHRAAPADESPARDAASVVLLRDGAAGLEVLLQRPSASADLDGVYVFPGGKVDAADADAALQGLLGVPAERLPARLGEPGLTPAQARALLVAAARELREEASIVLASGAALVPWSRWITPRNPPLGTQRFDTRFFLARLPDGAEVRPDPREVAAALWLTPREALRRAWEGAMALVAPQLMGLAQLARHATVASALTEAAGRVPPCILPQPFEKDGARALAYPGDARHPVRERALPGPTRLRLVRGRFEPFGGFEEWFA